MKNKIYIVSYDIPEFDTWGIYAYCSTKKKAHEKIKQLLDKIQNIKTLYYFEYEKDYDVDFKTYSDSDYLGDEWEEIADRINLYRAIHKELSFTDIKIEEKELI